MPDPSFDVFLSHNSRDKPAVERIAEKLRQARLEPWLDRWHLPGGQRFQAGLEAGITASRGCAYFVGGHGPGPWQQAELDVAQDRAVKDPSFQLFAVLLPGTPDPFDEATLSLFLRQRNWVDLRDGFEDPARFQRLVNAILGLPSGPTAPVALDPEESPYRGLQVFDEAHAEFFFGRATEVQRLSERLKTSRFLAVVGPSGSGKSSLVRAGLLPAIRNGALPGSHDWPVRVFTPGARPLDTLAAELALIDPERAMGKTLDELRTSNRTLDQAATLLLAGKSTTARLVLVVDQFEEIFTLCSDDAQRATFLANLLHAATVPDGRCLVILTLRADFYARCAAYPDLATLLASNQVLLGPLDEQGLRAVIEQPARRVGVSFEPGLVETILADVGNEPGYLPLLEHALFELWQQRQGTMLTLAAYRRSGGVGHALAQRADTIFAELTGPEQGVARRVLLRLTQPGEETEDTRRRAELDELVTRPAERGAVEEVINQLVAARLLTTSQDAADGGVQVDVAHEALIRAWPRLREWLDEDREGLRTHRRLTEATQEWDRHDRDADLLYRGARLAEAQTLAARAPELLNEQEQAFLAASVAARERELQLAAERRAREERQRQRIFAGLALFSLVALLLAGLAGVQWQVGVAETERANVQAAAAERARTESEAARATAEAETVRADGEAAVAAFERNNAVFAQNTAEAESTRAALAQNEAETQATIAVAESTRAAIAQGEAEAERNNAVQQAELALSRQLAAQAINDITSHDVALLLALEANRLNPEAIDSQGSLLTALESSPLPVSYLHTPSSSLLASVKFSPDDSLIAVAGTDGMLHLMNAASGQSLHTIQAHDAIVHAVSFDRGGTVVATAGMDRMIRVWDVETGEARGEIAGHTGQVTDIAFSPTDGRLLSSSEDQTVRLWNPATGELLNILQRQSAVLSIAFHPAGDLIAVGEQNGTLSLWHSRTGELIREFATQTVGIMTLAFSPDGAILAAGRGEPTILLLDMSTLAFVGNLPGHTGLVYDLTFSADGTTLASASVDGTVRLWDIAVSGKLRDVLPGPQGGVYGVSFTRDGATLATVGADESISLWNLGPRADVLTTPGHWGAIYTIAVCPNSNLVATGGNNDGTVMSWEADDLSPVAQPRRAHLDVVNDLACAPDGRTLASVGYVEGVIQFTNAADGAPAARPPIVSLATRDIITTVAFDPTTGWLAAAGTSGLIRIWDTTGQLQQEFGEPGSAVTALVVSPDGSLIATGDVNGGVRIWDTATSRQLWQVPAHSSSVLKACFLGDGSRLATGGADGMVKLWDPGRRQLDREFSGAVGPVTALACSASGQLVATGGADGTIRVFEVATGLIQREMLSVHLHHVSDLAFLADDQVLVSSGNDHALRLWDVATGAPLHATGPTPLTVAYAPDGTTIAAAQVDGRVRLWNPADESIEREYRGGSMLAIRLAYDGTGETVATAGTEGIVRIFAAASGDLLSEIAADGIVDSLAMSKDGALVAVGVRNGAVGVVKLFETATGRQRITLPDGWRSGWITSIAFSPDGARLASGSAQAVLHVWDTASGELLDERTFTNGGINSLAYADTAPLLAVGGYDGMIRLLDAESREDRGSLVGHTGSVLSLDFSADSRMLASGGLDTTVRLWDVATRKQIGPALPGHLFGTTSVSFRPDGKALVSTGWDSTIRIWDLDPESWRQRACGVANRNLSEAEWRLYMGDRPFQPTCPSLLLEPSPPDAEDVLDTTGRKRRGALVPVAVPAMSGHGRLVWHA